MSKSVFSIGNSAIGKLLPLTLDVAVLLSIIACAEGYAPL
jgi:hypothetical protein